MLSRPRRGIRRWRQRQPSPSSEVDPAMVEQAAAAVGAAVAASRIELAALEGGRGYNPLRELLS